MHLLCNTRCKMNYEMSEIVFTFYDKYYIIIDRYKNLLYI